MQTTSAGAAATLGPLIAPESQGDDILEDLCHLFVAHQYVTVHHLGSSKLQWVFISLLLRKRVPAAPSPHNHSIS